MAEARFPTPDEFWRRLDERGVEPDLVETLRDRLQRERGEVRRVGRRPIVEAVIERLLPGEVPPAALAVFLDEHFDRQLGRGDERAGALPRNELIPAGFAVLEEEAERRYGRPFADLGLRARDELLAAAEHGELEGPEGFDASTWFKRLLQLLLLGYGSDPRGMVEMGFPGPSFRLGHVWLDRGEVASRAARKRGYRSL